MNQLTVSDLITLLKNYEPLLKVKVEGCDCYCDAVDIRVDHDILPYEQKHANDAEKRACTNVDHHYLLIMSQR